jgi:predicted nucleotidyltransferase
MSSAVQTHEAGVSSDLHEGTAALVEDPRCLGVLLFGSAARDEAGENSDLDLLVAHIGKVPEEALDLLPAAVSVSFYDSARLHKLVQQSPLFGIHLAREGKRIYDPNGILGRSLGRAPPLSRAAFARVAGSTWRRYDQLVRDPRFGPDDPFSAAELYALAKQTAMLVSAMEHRYEFNREVAFESLAESFPSLSSAIGATRELESAWLGLRPAGRRKQLPLTMPDSGPTSVKRILETVIGGYRRHRP